MFSTFAIEVLLMFSRTTVLPGWVTAKYGSAGADMPEGWLLGVGFGLIGRAGCRGRGEISGGGGLLKKKKKEVRRQGRCRNARSRGRWNLRLRLEAWCMRGCARRRMQCWARELTLLRWRRLGVALCRFT